MKIELVHEGMDELLPMTDRSPGIHVSDVIHYLCLKLGHYDESKELNRAQLELGCALEHAIAERMEQDEPDRYLKIGELELDGMYGTPDLVDVPELSVVEIKLTWMSSNHAPDSPKFWRYWVQIKAYCRMMESTVGRLHVCHINGDYKGSGPVYRVWQGTFSPDELIENWLMLKTHGEKL